MAEQHNDIVKVTGSSPVIPTRLKKMVLDLRGKRNPLFPYREKFQITSTICRCSGGEVPLEHE